MHLGEKKFKHTPKASKMVPYIGPQSIKHTTRYINVCDDEEITRDLNRNKKLWQNSGSSTAIFEVSRGCRPKQGSEDEELAIDI